MNKNGKSSIFIQPNSKKLGLKYKAWFGRRFFYAPSESWEHTRKKLISHNYYPINMNKR